MNDASSLAARGSAKRSPRLRPAAQQRSSCRSPFKLLHALPRGLPTRDVESRERGARAHRVHAHTVTRTLRMRACASSRASPALVASYSPSPFARHGVARRHVDDARPAGLAQRRQGRLAVVGASPPGSRRPPRATPRVVAWRARSSCASSVVDEHVEPAELLHACAAPPRAAIASSATSAMKRLDARAVWPLRLRCASTHHDLRAFVRNDRAVAAPMPAAPPVISATFPLEPLQGAIRAARRCP
jgi:hypothetical protein